MNYHDITYPDMNNGDGLRVVLWLSGCSHHCYNCQNPQTWDENNGVPFDKSAKNEIFASLAKDYISGLTLSGGDPLYEGSLEGVYDLISSMKDKFHGKSIWLYTGYTWEKIFYPVVAGDFNPERDKIHKLCREMVRNVDVLVDGKYIDSERDVTLKWRGSRNQRVINVQESLKQDKVVLWCD